MEFRINGDFSHELSHVKYRDALVYLNKEINFFFADKLYGGKLRKIYCGIICVSKEFDDLFEARPPKLLRKEPALEFEYKLDFEIYQSADENSRRKYILLEFLNTIKDIFKIKKVKNFDSDSFLEDLYNFISSHNSLLD